MWEAGNVRLLVRPGSKVTGVGTIAQLFPGIVMNDRGQVLFQAQLGDGRRVLLRTR
jgi:hypothetical protein